MEGAVGGTFHLRNNYNDVLTFMPKPFVWHFFLSHIQRESSDLCGSLVACLQGLSPLGKVNLDKKMSDEQALLFCQVVQEKGKWGTYFYAITT